MRYILISHWNHLPLKKPNPELLVISNESFPHIPSLHDINTGSHQSFRIGRWRCYGAIRHEIEESPSSPIARPVGRRQSPENSPPTSAAVPQVTQPVLSQQCDPVQQYIRTLRALYSPQQQTPQQQHLTLLKTARSPFSESSQV